MTAYICGNFGSINFLELGGKVICTKSFASKQVQVRDVAAAGSERMGHSPNLFGTGVRTTRTRLAGF